MKPTIITIGVYGFDEQRFFQALQDAHIDTLCDLRARRGVRGADYAFANSERLQRRLAELNIRYVHLNQLAPSEEIRQEQHLEDKRTKIARNAAICKFRAGIAKNDFVGLHISTCSCYTSKKAKK